MKPLIGQRTRRMKILVSMNRRTPLATPSLTLGRKTNLLPIKSQALASSGILPSNSINQSTVKISPKKDTGLSAIEAEKEERNNKIRSLDKEVRHELRSIHQIATIKNLSLEDLNRLSLLEKEANSRLEENKNNASWGVPGRAR